MTIRHIHPLEQKPEARAEAMERLFRRCLASLEQLRRRNAEKDLL